MIYLLFIELAFGVLSAIVASNKERNAVGWFAIGFLFSLLGLIAALLVSEKEGGDTLTHSGSARQNGQRIQRKRTSASFDASELSKKCPDCVEEIKLEALACRYCGRRFAEEEVEQQVEAQRKQFQWEKKRRERVHKAKIENWSITSVEVIRNDILEGRPIAVRMYFKDGSSFARRPEKILNPPLTERLTRKQRRKSLSMKSWRRGRAFAPAIEASPHE